MRRYVALLSVVVAAVACLCAATVPAAPEASAGDLPTGDAETLLAPGQKDALTGFLECGKGRRARRAVSPVLVSRNGKRRAFVEVTAARPASPVFKAECANTTRLMIGDRRGPFRQALLIEPKRFRLGNGMKLVDWSRDSSLLLLEHYDWQWASDTPVAHHVLIFEAASGATHELEMDALTEGRNSERCDADVRVLGFTPENDVVVEAQIFTGLEMGEELEDVPPEERCEETTEAWIFDHATWEGRKATEAVRTQRYGRTRRR